MSDDSLSKYEAGIPLIKKKPRTKDVKPNVEESEEICEVDHKINNLVQKVNQTKKEVPESVEDNILDELVLDKRDNITFLNVVNKSLPSSSNSGRRNTDILESAEVSDLEWTKRYLTKDSSPDATCKLEKMSVCHLAAHFGSVGILGEVITRRPDLFKRADLTGRTPMHYAAWGGHVDCLAILLGLQVGALSRNVAENSVDSEEIRKFAIDEDKLKYLNSTRGETVELYNLCDSSHSCSNITENLKAVWSESTPLHNACARVQTECALALLACGADITKRDVQGRAPLDVLGLAIIEAEEIFEMDVEGFIRIIESFIQYATRDNIDCEEWLSNEQGTSPLHIAILLDSIKATELLLEHGAAPNIKNEYGQTSLHLAVLYVRTHILKCLINSNTNELKCNIDALNQDERTPLQLAVLEQWYDGVSILLDANASIIHQSNNTGDSALHFAAQCGNFEILEKLIKKLPNKKEWIDIKNKLRETPLFVAIKNGHDKCVRYLIDEGASEFIHSDGYTVLHKAIETVNFNVLLSLLQIEKIGSLLNIIDNKDGMTPLHWAALNGRADYTECLINKGAELPLKNHDGHTALHIAAKEGHSDVIKIILKENKHLANIKDNDGWLPFYRAAHHCQSESIELFLENGSNLAEIVPNENKNLIIQIIKSKMPRPAEFLDNIFNNCITFPNDYNFDQPNSEIVLNYSKIIPEQSESQPQMKAIAALFSPGSNYEIKKLILHPFIESFVLLKWKILQKLFYIILAMYCIFIVFFVDITIHMYQESYKNLFPPVIFQIKRYFLIALISAVMIVEIYFMQLSGLKKYFRRLEGKVKPCSLVMAFLILLSQTEIRLLFAFTHLLCWLEIPIMLSRFEEVGHYNQMFSKVALRVIKVFRFFGCFIIIGFSLIFWILMANDSFSNFWNSLIKTVVMMTSEFDYSAMMKDSILVNQVVVQLFFLVFLVCVPIVLMNLLLALAVTDVKDLKIEGKIQRLMEQVAFLENMEILLRKNISKNIINFFFVNHNWNVQNKITVYPGISYKDKRNILPKHIIERILENLNERKKIFEKDKRLSKKNAFVDKIEKNYTELVKIVNQISKDQQKLIKLNSKENAKVSWNTVFKNNKR